MKFKEIEALTDLIAAAIAPQIVAVVAPLIEQIKDLQSQVEGLKILPMATPEDLKNHRTEIKSWIDAVEKRFEEIPAPKEPDINDLVSRAVQQINPLIGELKSAVEAIPPLPDVASIVRDNIPPPIVPPVVMDDLKKLSAEIESFKEDVTLLVNSIPKAPELPDVAGMIKEAIDNIPPVDVKREIDIALDLNLDAFKTAIGAVEEKIDEIKKSIPEPVLLPDIPAMIKSEVALLPAPEPGKPGASVTIDDVAPMINDLVSKAVASLPPAKDGRSVAGALLDKSGALILTMSDGRIENLGPVVGRDVDMEEVKTLILSEVAKIPKPKDGRDGLDLKNMTIEHDGRKGFTLTIKDDEREIKSTIILPVVVWRDVYQHDAEYLKGDAVTSGGSVWHCEVDGAKGAPGNSDDWKLMVKKGRDGKDVLKLPAKTGPVKL